MKPALRESLRKILRSTGVDHLMHGMVAFLLAVATLYGRFVRHVYRRCWPAFGLPYYDPRYIAIAGADAWEWAERGFFAYVATKRGGTALDLCCGHGVFSALFIKRRAATVDAVDLDPRSIADARRRYSRTGVNFLQADVL